MSSRFSNINSYKDYNLISIFLDVTTVSESPEEKGITAVSAEVSGSTPAEGPEEGSDEDYKYVEEYDETCDDGEWVDEDEPVTSQVSKFNKQEL